MGARFVFRPGPVLETPVHTAADLDALTPFDPAEELGFVGETLGNLRGTLQGELPLLGFAGAPLTLAFFLLAGGSPGTGGDEARALMDSNPAAMHRLLDKLADMTAGLPALPDRVRRAGGAVCSSRPPTWCPAKGTASSHFPTT